MSTILDYIRAANPLIRIIVASIPPLDINEVLTVNDLINDGIDPHHGGYTKLAAVLNAVFKVRLSK